MMHIVLNNKLELSENKKDSIIYKNNPMIFKTTISTQSINLVNYSLKKKSLLEVKTQLETFIQAAKIYQISQFTNFVCNYFNKMNFITQIKEWSSTHKTMPIDILDFN